MAESIASLFPGRAGRMQFIRVMLKLRMPELRRIDPNEALAPELAVRLKAAKAEVVRG